MRKFSLGRRGAIAVGVAAAIAAASSTFFRLGLPPTRCEHCGEGMRPFRHDDLDWVGSNIYECGYCGFIIDQNAWEFGQQLWAVELRENAALQTPAARSEGRDRQDISTAAQRRRLRRTAGIAPQIQPAKN